MPTTLGLLGTGRLGSAIRDLADARGDVTTAWAVGRGTPPADRVDVAVDVSHPDAVAHHLAWAQATGTPLVVGTTGWDPALLRDDVGVPVLVAPNFSLGVALVRRLAHALGGYAASAPVDVDLAVTESHHRSKVDSPSGTALALREALAEGAGRTSDTVQTTSLRVGGVVGEHEVLAVSELETITLRHVAHDRRLFATGALTAALWLAGRTAPGRYTLDDLAEDTLRHLLVPTARPSLAHRPAAPAAGSAA
ncbi:4-hydroxy-tetrahydrodipicolinate reductase [Ornithinimicrobium cerasi]|uniref:4-hydroxy-tetrahydrodipicolinate reductase n=1 Tax=Ornithinimicrobium cerasi TaxID=2248773 RepID=UPI000EFE1748|nr:dihydrodipicolinate reductase C-terminal domain-containing protein [Ornithinimicrobium cerasi]